MSHETATISIDNTTSGDGRRVALIKSHVTNNRFYALVPPDAGIRNADVVENIPHDLLLGIAYPCLEDGLNDFAVIRTTFETLELFPDDPALGVELQEMISDARCTLVRRLMELLERFIANKAHFLGTDLDEFRNAALQMMRRGFQRQSLDQMMKVDVFCSVGRDKHAASSTPLPDDAIYRYEFHNSENLERIEELEGREFLLALLSDVLDSVLDDENYNSRSVFDRNVFQQFIALIFITYSATDPVFYGTHKDDYCVSKDKDMDDTPLYRAIGRELRRLTENPQQSYEDAADDAESWAEIGAAFENLSASSAATISGELANEELLLRHIASICATAHQLRKRHAQTPQGAADLAKLIMADAARLVEMLKKIGVVSPLAYNPGESELEELQRRLNS